MSVRHEAAAAPMRSVMAGAPGMNFSTAAAA